MYAQAQTPSVIAMDMLEKSDELVCGTSAGSIVSLNLLTGATNTLVDSPCGTPPDPDSLHELWYSACLQALVFWYLS